MDGDNYIITLTAEKYLHDDQTDGGLHNDQTDADLHNDQTDADFINDHTLIFKFTYGNIWS